jgi:hypothetical protein
MEFEEFTVDENGYVVMNSKCYRTIVCGLFYKSVSLEEFIWIQKRQSDHEHKWIIIWKKTGVIYFKEYFDSCLERRETRQYGLQYDQYMGQVPD